MKLKMKPVPLFIPITRMERRDDGLIVEGYCFVNEKVRADKWTLKRSAMEAAGADYMNWGAVREMHQSWAAGTATAEGCGITWDENGCYLRALIVDAEAIEKCEKGVYKGFSVGVKFDQVRGTEVERCTWIENSLVDRPADPDAVFTIARADGVDDAAAEFDVEELSEAPEERSEEPNLERADAPASFADLVPQAEAEQLFYLAFDLLRVTLRRIQRASVENREELCRTSIQQFADYLVPIIVAAPATEDCCYWAARPELERLLQREDLPELLRAAVEEIRDQVQVVTVDDSAAASDLSRLQELQTENTDLLRRTLALTDRVTALTGERDTARGEVETVRTELTTAQRRISELEAQPAAGDRPVLHPQALDRTFLSAQRTAVDQTSDALKAELKQLQEELPKEPDHEKRQQGAARINVLRMQLRGLGVTA